MDWSEFKSLTIGGMRLKKLQTSSGIVLFNQDVEPHILPTRISMVKYDGSNLPPTQMYIAHYDTPTPGYISVVATVYQRTNDYILYYGSTGSIYGYYKLLLYRGTPYKLLNNQSIGQPPKPMLPIEGYGVGVGDSNQQKQYRFTNPYSSTQYQNVTIRFGEIPSPETETLTLDVLTYRDTLGNPILSVNEGYVGYTSEIFGNDEAYDFNAHRGEEFVLTTPGGANRISFVIG